MNTDRNKMAANLAQILQLDGAAYISAAKKFGNRLCRIAKYIPFANSFLVFIRVGGVLISVGRVTPCAPFSAFAAGRGSPQGGTGETVSKGFHVD
jgi:hypothetical protein